MKVPCERPTPKSLDQRTSYASEFVSEMTFPEPFSVLVDGMGNEFNAAFGSWPTCYYVIQDKRLQYVGECDVESDSASYNVRELFAYLNKAV